MQKPQILATLFLLLILLAVGILVTNCTALLPPVMTSISPSATAFSDYGFPVPWKEYSVLYFAPFHPQACPTPVHSIGYDWFGFAVDVLFYMAVAYGLIVLGRKYLHGKTVWNPRADDLRVN